MFYMRTRAAKVRVCSALPCSRAESGRVARCEASVCRRCAMRELCACAAYDMSRICAAQARCSHARRPRFQRRKGVRRKRVCAVLRHIISDVMILCLFDYGVAQKRLHGGYVQVRGALIARFMRRRAALRGASRYATRLILSPDIARYARAASNKRQPDVARRAARAARRCWFARLLSSMRLCALRAMMMRCAARTALAAACACAMRYDFAYSPYARQSVSHRR